MCGKSFAQRAGVSVHKRKNCKNRNRHLLTVEAPDFDIIYTIEVPVMPVQQQEVTTSNVQVTTSQDIEKMINDTKKFAEEDADTKDTKEPKVETRWSSSSRRKTSPLLTTSRTFLTKF